MITYRTTNIIYAINTSAVLMLIFRVMRFDIVVASSAFLPVNPVPKHFMYPVQGHGQAFFGGEGRCSVQEFPTAIAVPDHAPCVPLGSTRVFLESDGRPAIYARHFVLLMSLDPNHPSRSLSFSVVEAWGGRLPYSRRALVGFGLRFSTLFLRSRFLSNM